MSKLVRSAAAVAVLLTLACALSACRLLDFDSEIRYRITVKIDTPKGTRSASGVWASTTLPGGIDQSASSRFKGEAIPLDLPNGRTVFALLDIRAANGLPSPGADMLAEQVLKRHFYPEPRYFPKEIGGDRRKEIEFLAKNVRNLVKLDCQYSPAECPMLVVFANLADPLTVHSLDPNEISSQLGSGYRLRGMYLQVTDDGPTHQLGKRLPWLDSVRGKNLDGGSTSSYYTLANSLSYYSFKRWGHRPF